MDTLPPDTFSDQDVLAAMTVNWNIRADHVRYAPKGTGSYHWVVDVNGRTMACLS